MGNAIRLVAAGFVLVGMVFGASALGRAVSHDDTHATVVRVIDGDTLVAEVDGDETTIRLLNVDTPETKDPNDPVQCLGPEATEYLESRLQPGDEITLEYDQERLDPYDRTLAGVYEGGTLVNADIAARGLGVAVIFEPNRKFYDEVKAAQDAARAAGLGLYDVAVACTLPAQVASAVVLVDALPTALPVSIDDAETALVDVDAGLAHARSVGALVAGLGSSAVMRAAYGDAESSYRADLSGAVGRAESLRQRIDGERLRLVEVKRQAAEEAARKAAAEKARKAAEAKARKAAAAEAARKAAKEAARKAAAAEAAADRAAAARRAASSGTSGGGSTGSGGSSSSDPYRGYTGPRCYAPGGKTWKPCP